MPTHPHSHSQSSSPASPLISSFRNLSMSSRPGGPSGPPLYPPGPYTPLDPGMPAFVPDPTNTVLAYYKLPPLPNLGMPPLPTIQNSDLERRVFTHSSYIMRTRKATSLEMDLLIEDNEKLEHVGDSIINTIVTLVLNQIFPHLQVGGATLLKGHLVSNLSLSQLSKFYGLPDRLIAPAQDIWNLRNGEKIQANLFEAYVAALFLSYLRPPTAPSSPSPLSPPATPSRSHPSSMSNLTAEADAEGRAFAQVGYWLKPLFTPLCHWLLAEIRGEQRRLDENQATANADNHMDTAAIGAMARLNEHMMKFHKTQPSYMSSRAGTDAWKAVCTLVDKDGKQ